MKVIALILAGLLALSIFSHYQTGKKLTRICETITWYDDEVIGRVLVGERGRFDPSKPFKFEVNFVENTLDRHNYLLKSNTPEGITYQEWILNIRPKIRTCQERLPDEYYVWDW